jgi:hypothetical protein
MVLNQVAVVGTDQVSTESGKVDSGSFRDRDGRIYLHGERVFRGLNESALDDYRKVRQTGFFRRFTDAGELVKTREIETSANPLPQEIVRQWAGFLEHERVGLISYPYEWSFGMLKSAAMLQLRLTEAAIQEGFTLKDATPYNVQFVGKQPVFIDIASFEPLAEGEPWAGYRQFCEMFLFPLMLQAYKGVHFQPFLRPRPVQKRCYRQCLVTGEAGPTLRRLR